MHARDASFDNRYDNDTLFYDVFWGAYVSGDKRHIIAIGPPLRNLEPRFKTLRITSVADGSIVPWQYRALDRHMQIYITAPDTARALLFESELGTFTVELPTVSAQPFAGKRVLMTKSKDNDLQWIADWASFHRDVHGINAVLLYDNASTTYSSKDVVDCLAQVPGIVSAVVPWPFKFGPQGIDATQYWDSDYCEYGILEHARRCFLSGASAVINADIDEVILSTDGASVCEAAIKSWSGIVRYHGRWVVGGLEKADGASPARPRHKDFDTILRREMRRRLGIIPVDANRCPAKWTVVPSRCPDGAQWRTHVIDRWPAARLSTSAFSYRHFRELSNGWKYKRAARADFDPAIHEKDLDLVDAMGKVRWSDEANACAQPIDQL
jgi:hypothetical protein